MALTNSQYDAVMRLYDEERSANRRELDTREDFVLSQCPDYQKIKTKIIDLSYNYANSRISNHSFNEEESKAYKSSLENLKAQMQACLASIGKPANYLDQIYTCPKCKDTGFIQGKHCDCFKKKAIDFVYRDSNLKNITISENFSTFNLNYYDNLQIYPDRGNMTARQIMKNNLAICKDFVKDFDAKHPSLLLYGNSGTGKTFMSNCIAKELLESIHSVIYLTSTEFFDKYKKFNYNENDDSLSADYLLECDLLIIDDLGTEPKSAYNESKLFYCVNERILRQKSTIISSNIDIIELRDRYSERTFSRLISHYTPLEFLGNDIRLLKKM